jgi:hypothetical protein
MPLTNTRRIAEIREVADVDGDGAQAAAREAIEAVGGQIEKRCHTGGIEAGRMRVHHNEVWWCPAMRSVTVARSG